MDPGLEEEMQTGVSSGPRWDSCQRQAPSTPPWPQCESPLLLGRCESSSGGPWIKEGLVFLADVVWVGDPSL